MFLYLRRLLYIFFEGSIFCEGDGLLIKFLLILQENLFLERKNEEVVGLYSKKFSFIKVNKSRSFKISMTLSLSFRGLI